MNYILKFYMVWSGNTPPDASGATVGTVHITYGTHTLDRNLERPPGPKPCLQQFFLQPMVWSQKSNRRDEKTAHDLIIYGIPDPSLLDWPLVPFP